MDGAFAGSSPLQSRWHADSYVRSGPLPSESEDGSEMPLTNPEILRAARTRCVHQEVEGGISAHLSFPIRIFFGDPQNLS